MYAWSLAASAAAPEQPVGRDPRVVPGGEVLGAEAVGDGEHRVEPDVAVAADARIRRPAGRVLGQERLHDARRERRAQVDREVREPHPVRDRAREPDRVRRAARRLGVVRRVAPELERDRDRLAPGALRRAARRPPSRPRRTSPRACGRGRPARRATTPRGRRRRAPRGARRRPGRRRGACPARGRRARRRSPPAPIRAASSTRRALGRSVDRRGARGDRRAAAGRLEARVGDAVAVQREPDPHEVAARAPRRPRRRTAGTSSAPARVLQVLREGLGVHAPSVGGYRWRLGSASVTAWSIVIRST